MIDSTAFVHDDHSESELVGCCVRNIGTEGTAVRLGMQVVAANDPCVKAHSADEGRSRGVEIVDSLANGE